MKVININEYNDLELAFMCLLGYFGTGIDRLKALGTRYTKVQPLVNQLVAGKVPKSTTSTTQDKEHMLACLKEALVKNKPTEKDYLEYVDYLIEIVSKEV